MIPNKCWVLNQCIYIYIATSCHLPNNKGQQLHTLQWTYMATMWYPPVISYFITPSTIDIPTISPSEIGVICTNLAIELGHHFVAGIPPCSTGKPRPRNGGNMTWPVDFGEIQKKFHLEIAFFRYATRSHKYNSWKSEKYGKHTVMAIY